MKNYLKSTAAIVLFSATMFTTPASAGGIPVFDMSGLTQQLQQLAQMQQQYETQLQQLTQLQEQYEQVVKQVEAMTGSTDLSGILSNLDSGQNAAAGLESISQNVSSVISGGGSGEMAQSINSTIENFGLEGLSEVAGSDKPLERAAAQYAGVSTAAIAAGEAGEVDAANAQDRAETLRGQVGDQADVKEAIDYNTLVLTEMVANQATIMRLLSSSLLNDGTAELMSARSALSGTALRIKEAPE